MSDITKVIKFVVVGDVAKAQSGFRGLSKDLKETANSGSGFKGLGKNIREAIKGGQGIKGVGGAFKSAAADAGGLKGIVGKVGIGMAAMGAAAIAAGAAIAIKFGADSIDTFKKVAGEVLGLKRVTGMTAEDASRLGFSLKQSGVDASVGQKSFTLFGKNLANAADGGKKAAAMTKLLGFGFTDAAGKVLPMSKLLPQVADKFEKMPDGAEKSALAMKLFGKSGVAMIPFLNKGAAGLDALAKKSDKFGNTLSDKQLQALKDSKAAQRDWDAAMQGLQVTLGKNLLPLMTQGAQMINSVLVPAFEQMAQGIEQNQGVFTAFGNIFRWVWNNVLLPGIKLAVNGFVTMQMPLAYAVQALGKLFGNKDMENFGAGMVKAGQDVKDFVNGLQGIPDEVAPKVTVRDDASTKLKSVNSKIKSLKDKLVHLSAEDRASGKARKLKQQIDALRSKKVILTAEVRVRAKIKKAGMSDSLLSRAIAGNAGFLLNSRTYAGGGLENHSPSIYRTHDGMRIFNEPETRGEAYIPLANDWRRPRARAIWRQTGRELGMFAGGGINGGGAGGGGVTIYAPITVTGAVTPDAGRQVLRYLQALQKATKGRPLAIKTQH